MVTRKPLLASAEASLGRASLPPYPVSPTVSNASQSFRGQDLQDEYGSSQCEPDSSEVWSEGSGTTARQNTGIMPFIPDSLRVGSLTSQGLQAMKIRSPTTKDQHRQKVNIGGTGTNDIRESSASAWSGFPERLAPPTEPPPPPPLPKGKNFFQNSLGVC